MLGGDRGEVLAELFVVPLEGPQDALPAREVGPLEAYGAQVEVLQGELPAHEVGLSEVFADLAATELGAYVALEATEPWVCADLLVIVG